MLSPAASNTAHVSNTFPLRVVLPFVGPYPVVRKTRVTNVSYPLGSFSINASAPPKRAARRTRSSSAKLEGSPRAMLSRTWNGYETLWRK